MQRRFARSFIVLVFAAGLTAGAALAKDGESESWFVDFLQSLLSTPDRQVTLSGFKGAFSANPTVERITVADREGTWLELDGVEVTWNRAALFDRMIDIESLKAARIQMLRKPVGAAEPRSSGGLSGPPLAIEVKAISLPQVVLAAPVAGAEAELTATGSARLTPEALAAELSVDRQDRAGSLSHESPPGAGSKRSDRRPQARRAGGRARRRAA